MKGSDLNDHSNYVVNDWYYYIEYKFDTRSCTRIFEKFIITKFDTFGGFLLYIAQLTMGLILSTIVWPVTLMNVIVMIKNLFNEK